MSAITDYASLKTAIANWLHRTDLDLLTGDFIALAEAKMSAQLMTRAMDIRANLTCTAGNAYVTLPTDMLEMNRLIVLSDPINVLRYESPDQLSIDYPTSIVGKPTLFAIIGSQVQLAPIPDSAYTLEITYLQRIPSLSLTNTTNWLIAAFPNAYLYGSLVAAQPFIENDERLPMFEKLYAQAIQEINSIDWYSGTTMRVRAR